MRSRDSARVYPWPSSARHGLVLAMKASMTPRPIWPGLFLWAAKELRTPPRLPHLKNVAPSPKVVVLNNPQEME